MTELEQQVHTNGNGLETVDEDEHNKTRPADIEQVLGEYVLVPKENQ